jgi:hypothetical protein
LVPVAGTALAAGLLRNTARWKPVCTRSVSTGCSTSSSVTVRLAKYVFTQEVDMQTLDSLFLFKALIKVGCTWKEDVSHRKWSERLYFSEDIRDKVLAAVVHLDEGNDYKFEDCSIWIA